MDLAHNLRKEKRMERETFQGLPITIEYRKGDLKPGKDTYGWPMYADYGFFNNSSGADGEDLDVFIGPDKESPRVFLLALMEEDVFDEHKVLLGFLTFKDAELFSRDQYGSWKVGPIIEISMEDLKETLELQSPKVSKRDGEPTGMTVPRLITSADDTAPLVIEHD